MKDDVGTPTCNQHLTEAFQHLFHSGPMTSLAVDSSTWPLISKTLTQELGRFESQGIQKLNNLEWLSEATSNEDERP